MKNTVAPMQETSCEENERIYLRSQQEIELLITALLLAPFLFSNTIKRRNSEKVKDEEEDWQISYREICLFMTLFRCVEKAWLSIEVKTRYLVVPSDPHKPREP